MMNTNKLKYGTMKKLFSRSLLAAVAMCVALLSVSCATPAIKKPNKPSGTTTTNKPAAVESQSENATVFKVAKDTVN